MIIATVIVSGIFLMHLLWLLFSLLKKDANINQNVLFQGGRAVGLESVNNVLPILQTSLNESETIVKGVTGPRASVTSSFAGMMIRISDLGSGQLYDVYLENQIVIGRTGGSAAIQLSDSNVSSKHCMLYRKGDLILLQDLNSTNHTYLNGCVLESPMPVCTGDTISVGNTALQLQYIYANA